MLNIRNWPFTAQFAIWSWTAALVLFVVAAVVSLVGSTARPWFALGAVAVVVGGMAFVAAVWAIDTEGTLDRSLPFNRTLGHAQWFAIAASALAFVLYRGFGLASVAVAGVTGFAGVVWLANHLRDPRFREGDLVTIECEGEFDVGLIAEAQVDRVRLVSGFSPKSATRPKCVQTGTISRSSRGEESTILLEEFERLQPRLVWRGLSVPRSR